MVLTPTVKVFAGKYVTPASAGTPVMSAGTIAGLSFGTATGQAAVGSIFLTDENGTPLTAAITTPAPFMVAQIVGIIGPVPLTTGGVTTQSYVYEVKYSTLIKPNWVKGVEAHAFADPTVTGGLQYSTLTIPTAYTTAAGDRYVIRIQYRDLGTLSVQPIVFTKSYEVTDLAAGTTAGALADALAAEMAKDPTIRVKIVHTAGANTIDLEALPYTYNEIDKFAVVSFTASLYKTTLVDNVLYNNYYQDLGATFVTSQPATEGFGYFWKVRDLEKLGLAYTGDIYQTDWIKRNTGYIDATDSSKQYSQTSIDWAQTYQSNSQQYPKSDIFNLIIFDNTNTAGSTTATAPGDDITALVG